MGDVLIDRRNLIAKAAPIILTGGLVGAASGLGVVGATAAQAAPSLTWAELVSVIAGWFGHSISASSVEKQNAGHGPATYTDEFDMLQVLNSSYVDSNGEGFSMEAVAWSPIGGAGEGTIQITLRASR